MRVTHLTPSGQMGGAECVILECIAAAAQRGSGAETSVVALSAGPFLTAAESLGATTRVVVPPAAFGSIGDSFSSVGTVVRALLPALRRFPNFVGRFSAAVKGLLPQIIHSHGIKTHVLAALLFRRVPVVWHIHDYLGTRPVSSWLLRLLARRCALAIAVSDSVAQDARRLFAGRLPIVVVHNCVDCERFRPDGPALDLDALSGLPPAPAGTIRIGLPATFARWKGQDVFIKALARLEHPVRAYVIGGALYETERSQWSEGELRQLVSELGLETQVGFTGFVDDMPSAYRALDVVVHASTRPEPFGLVIVEAMACGRALVAAPTGGAAALFVDRVQALAAESGNARALAAALDALAGDSALRAALGARARTHALASFGRDRFASSLGAALARVASI